LRKGKGRERWLVGAVGTSPIMEKGGIKSVTKNSATNVLRRGRLWRVDKERNASPGKS